MSLRTSHRFYRTLHMARCYQNVKVAWWLWCKASWKNIARNLHGHFPVYIEIRIFILWKQPRLCNAWRYSVWMRLNVRTCNTGTCCVTKIVQRSSFFFISKSKWKKPIASWHRVNDKKYISYDVLTSTWAGQEYDAVFNSFTTNCSFCCKFAWNWNCLLTCLVL